MRSRSHATIRQRVRRSIALGLATTIALIGAGVWQFNAENGSFLLALWTRGQVVPFSGTYLREFDELGVSCTASPLRGSVVVKPVAVFDTDEDLIHHLLASFCWCTHYVRERDPGLSINSQPAWVRTQLSDWLGADRSPRTPLRVAELRQFERFGFPLRCSGLALRNRGKDQILYGSALQWPEAWDPRANPTGSVFLPTRIDGLRLLANILIWGLPWFLLLSGLSSLRGCHRNHRGRCGVCGYDLGGDLASGCPECGAGREHSEGSCRPAR